MPLSARSSFFPPHIHQWIYLGSLYILAAAMPTSHYIMSLTQLIMGGNWLLEGNYKEKWKRFTNNKAAVAFSMIYLLHVVGLIWTTDIAYGLGKDLIDKLPMLTLTFLVVSSKPPAKEKLQPLLFIFFATVLVTSIIGFFVHYSGNYVNFRRISPFISHVYFSMMVVMTIFALPWYVKKSTSNKKILMLIYGVSAWLVVYLFILRSLTGLLCFGGVVVLLLARQAYITRFWWLRLSIILLVTLSSAAGIGFLGWMYSTISQKITPDPLTLNDTTSLGNKYKHFIDYPERENGHFLYYFISEDEIREAWNQRSELDFDGEDIPGNELRITLYRYLSSKGLRKDAESLEKLTQEEISAIERGIANYLYTVWPGFVVRIHQSVWEVYWYRAKGDPTGHTFTQRIELWRASWVAFKENPVFGWGTGDIFIAVDYGLHAIDSKMENFRMKPHNQYLLFLLTLGVIGSVVIYSLYAFFVSKTRAYRYWPFNVFLIIMMVSMLANHPIDSQAGQTFFTFFTLYFGFIYPQTEPD